MDKKLRCKEKCNDMAIRSCLCTTCYHLRMSNAFDDAKCNCEVGQFRYGTGVIKCDKYLSDIIRGVYKYATTS